MLCAVHKVVIFQFSCGGNFAALACSCYSGGYRGDVLCIHGYCV